jgi:hypothetical protein
MSLIILIQGWFTEKEINGKGICIHNWRRGKIHYKNMVIIDGYLAGLEYPTKFDGNFIVLLLLPTTMDHF